MGRKLLLLLGVSTILGCSFPTSCGAAEVYKMSVNKKVKVDGPMTLELTSVTDGLCRGKMACLESVSKPEIKLKVQSLPSKTPALLGKGSPSTDYKLGLGESFTLPDGKVFRFDAIYPPPTQNAKELKPEDYDIVLTRMDKIATLPSIGK